jgi:hypothetical protein
MCFRGKVYNSRFLYSKYYSTPPLLVESFINNYINTFLVALRSWPGHLYSEVIHEGNYSPLAINLSLHEVYIEENE